MEQNNNFYQQNWNKPPQKPEKGNRWIIWVVVAVVGVGLLSWMFYGISQLGKKIGNEMNKVASTEFEMMDSVTNKQELNNLLVELGNDSISIQTKMKLTTLSDEADSIYHLLNSYNAGFRDTLANVSGISAMNQIWGQNYFIKTRRAFRLKQLLLRFREESFRNLPTSAQDPSLYSNLPVDELGNNMPGFMKNMMNFENLNFNQPVFTIRMNFQKLKKQTGQFEQSIINAWNLEIQNEKNAALDSVK